MATQDLSRPRSTHGELRADQSSLPGSICRALSLLPRWLRSLPALPPTRPLPAGDVIFPLDRPSTPWAAEGPSHPWSKVGFTRKRSMARQEVSVTVSAGSSSSSPWPCGTSPPGPTRTWRGRAWPQAFRPSRGQDGPLSGGGRRVGLCSGGLRPAARERELQMPSPRVGRPSGLRGTAGHWGLLLP